MSMHMAMVDMVVPAITKDGTLYTNGTGFRKTVGYASMIISSTAGSITVTQQCSKDGSIWYDPYDHHGNVIGKVCAALTVTTGRIIQFYPVLAPHIRFKIVEGNVATTTVAITLLFQEEA